MEDVKTTAMDSAAAAAAAEETPLLIAAGPTLETGTAAAADAANTGSLSETNPLANAGPPSPLTGCYLLIIIGEPHSEEARRVILEQLRQGK